MTQPPYGQNSYNPSPAPQYPAAPSAYPAYSNEPAGAYPAPAYPSEPSYPSAPAYPSTPMSPYSLPEAQKKSPVLGIVGLGIVVVCTIIYFVFSYSLYNSLFDILGPDWANTGAVPEMSTLTDAQVSAIIGPGVGIAISSLVGMVGLIISIVATAQKKGRGMAIAGIILGVLAPFSIIIAATISLSVHGGV